MGISKLNVLNHVVYTLRHVGRTVYLDAGLHEASHKLFKKKFKHSSKTRIAAIGETIDNNSDCDVGLLQLLRDWF